MSAADVGGEVDALLPAAASAFTLVTAARYAPEFAAFADKWRAIAAAGVTGPPLLSQTNRGIKKKRLRDGETRRQKVLFSILDCRAYPQSFRDFDFLSKYF